MRLTRLSATRFVGLSRWEAEVDAPMVVFFGSNEAGKSTVKELIAGLLFGFGNKKKDRLSLIGWGAAQAGVAGSLRLRDGREMTVTRTVEEKHAGCQIVESGQMSEMGNAPLNAVGAVTRDVYESVYALGRDQMVFPRDAWREVQDRLLDVAVTNRLRPAMDVAQAIEEEAKNFWRADKRGKPLCRGLADERWKLKQALRDARDRQQRLVELQQNYEARRQRIELIRARVRDSEAFLREAAVQRELKSRFDQIRQQEREAGDVTAFDMLPEDIAGKLRQLEEGIASVGEKLREDRQQLAALEEVRRGYSDAYANALDMAGEIEEATRLSVQCAADEEAAARLREQLELVREEWRGLIGGLLTENDPAVAAQRLARIDMAGLKAASSEAADAGKKLYRVQDALNRAREGRAARRKAPVLAGVLGGVLLLAGAAGLLPLAVTGLPYTLPEPLPLVAGGVAVVGLLALVLALTGFRPGQRRHMEEMERDLMQARQVMDAAAAAVREALGGLSVPEERIIRADEKLPWDVERLNMKREQVDELSDRLEEIERRLAGNGDRIAECTARCLGRAPAGAAAGVEAMNGLLAEAREARSRCEAAVSGIERVKKQIERSEDLFRRAAEERRNLLEALTRIGDGDPEEAVAQIARRRGLKRQAQAGREALASDERFASRLLRLEAMQERWPYHDEAVSETQEYVRTARRQLEMLSGELGSIEQEIKNLADQPAPGEIQSRIDEVDRIEAEGGLERDRQALAAGVIRAGRRRFQERHQPDVIRRAGVYMQDITGGRYRRLLLPEDGSGLRVYSPDAGRYVDPEADRLSKGTLGQLYLSLRLAMVDHLDPRQEPLPLLLDEVFADWDEQRLRQGLLSVAGITERRQVMLFTCHAWMIERLREAGVACRTVEL